MRSKVFLKAKYIIITVKTVQHIIASLGSDRDGSNHFCHGFQRA